MGAVDVLCRGTQIGRYVVLDLRGRGAMGDVYAVYDPELDRKVALKRLHLVEEDRRVRLIREARALARLSHPNVITVYDVGTWNDEVFLTMELVGGTELGAWLANHRGQWPVICSMFVAAGRGLVAAHAVGLVHRDFKPANVLVADDGIIKVLDFGLATVDGPQHLSRELSSMTDGVVSRSHSVAGTPAYMAPELYDGAAADARADQYAFCVALYEALHGERPFHGADAAALQADKRRGRPPGSRAAVPRAIQQIVARGLSPDPDARFATMVDLLTRLERIPARRRRNLGIAGAVLGGLAIAAMSWDTALSPAEEGARQIEEVWSPSARRGVRAALLATHASYAEATWNSVEATIDGYANAWIAAYRDAVEATEERAEQSVAMMDLRIGCLRARRAELGALVEVLADREISAVEDAVAATSKLTPLDGCSDVEALAAEVTPPLPAVAAAVMAVRERLISVQALNRAGRYAEGLELAAAAATAAQSLAYEPLIAEALLQLGSLRREMGDYTGAEEVLLASAEMAERAGHHPTAAAAAIEVLYLIGYRQLRFAEAMLWARHARAAVLHPGAPEHLKADFFDILGIVYASSGRYAEARDAFAEVLRLREPRETSALATTLSNLALLEASSGRVEVALGHLQRALAIEERYHGPTHPAVGFTLIGLGGMYVLHGDLDAGVLALERALAILTPVLGPDHAEVAAVLMSLGWALSRRGQHEEGRVHCERALAVMQRTYGDEHRSVGRAMSTLGGIHARMGDHVEAERLHRRGLEICEAQLGPDHPELATDLMSLADDLKYLGRHEEANALRERAREIRDASGLGAAAE